MKLLKRIPLWAWPIIFAGAAGRPVPHPRRAQGDLRGRRRVPPEVHHQAAEAIGPFDLSVTKAVIYLWITVVIVVRRGDRHRARSLKQQPGRFQAFHGDPVRTGPRRHRAAAVMKSGDEQWFPYVGGAFFFMLVCNLLGLIPLPFGEHHQLSFYAATGNLNVTLTLALLTFLFTHYAGIRKKGAVRLRQELGHAVGAAGAASRSSSVIHVISEIFRLVSLSVRLFANMVAGHAILAVFFAMALIFQSYLIAGVPCRARRCSCTCSRSSSPSSRPSSSPFSPPSTSAAHSTRTTETDRQTAPLDRTGSHQGGTLMPPRNAEAARRRPVRSASAPSAPASAWAS